MNGPSSRQQPQHKILACSGGGTRAGLVQSEILAALHGGDTSGHDVLRAYQEAWGNSAGSLVLAALAAGYTPNEIHSMLQSTDFLKEIYKDLKEVEMDPKKKRKLHRLSHYSVRPKDKKTLGEKANDLGMQAVVAGVEIAAGGFYDSASKTNFIRQVLNHQVPPDHPAAQTVSAMASNYGKNDEALLYGYKTLKEINQELGVHLNFVMQDRRTKETCIATSFDDVSGTVELKDLNEKVRLIQDNAAFLGTVADASSRPRPFYSPSRRDGYDDGGMTGHNIPSALAMAMAIKRKINPKSIRMVLMSVGPLAIDYVAEKDPVLYANMFFDKFFNEKRKWILEKTARLLPTAQVQLAYFSPTSTNPKDSRNKIPSTYSTKEFIAPMRKWLREYTRTGEIGNHKIRFGKRAYGSDTYKGALERARNILGFPEQAPENVAETRKPTVRPNVSASDYLPHRRFFPNQGPAQSLKL